LRMRVAVVTLGCKVNQSESAIIEGELRSRGYEVVGIEDSPTLCIVNTCTVTSRSDQQSRQIIRKAVRHGARVIATGCYAQLRPKELSEIGGVIYVTGNSGKGCLVDRLEEVLASDRVVSSISQPDAPVTTGTYHSNRARAFLKIQDGCDRSCSYCTVPFARGRSRSLGVDDVLKAVDGLYASGYREVVLTGIHTGLYGRDLNPCSSLSMLVRRIKDACPDVRIRLSSIEPDECDDEILSLLEEGLICPHLHIPLQSGSDRILDMMNRGYTTASYRGLIERVVSINPDVSIGTDVIVGFPGEGEREFQQTLDLIQELPFSYVHVFQYSKRPGTRAASMTGHIDPSTRRKRVGLIRAIASEKKRQYISRFCGRILEVIIEENNRTNGFLRAISDNYIRVLVEDGGLRPRSRTLVRAVSLLDNELLCKPLKNT